MTKTTKKPRKEIAPERREQFVAATCAIIDRVGLADASLNQIAGEIGISAGLVAHYFGDKKSLLYATMRKIMGELKATVEDLQKGIDRDDPAAQIRVIINSNFHNSQNNRAIIKTWLNFWVASLYDEELKRLQRVNEHVLFSSLYSQFMKLAAKDKARDAARGLAAMIDGLWLHLALSNEFAFEDGRRLAHQYLDQFLAHTAPSQALKG